MYNPYRDAERPFLALAWLGDVHPSDRLRSQPLPLLRVDAFTHGKALFGGNRFDPIYSGGFLALVVLRDPTHREQACCSGLHQQLLQLLDCSFLTSSFGSEDALLYPVHMLFKLAPGQRAPTLTLRVKWWVPLVSGCLRLCHTSCASFFHVIVLT